MVGINPETGKEVLAKDGRFGPYVTERTPEPEPQVDPATGEVIETPAQPEPAATTAAAKKTTAAAAKKAAAAGETATATKAAATKAKKPAKKAAAPKERTASLFKSMDPQSVDLETALKLLSCPGRSGPTRSPVTRSPRRTAATART